MVKVTIDQNTCTGCGTCEALCSEVFEMGDTGKAQITEEYQEDDPSSGEVPEDINCTETAAQSCPVDAIDVE
ncbi:hypothetical protein AKJ65_01120 [candidate division MSBL1 archaeon SCGC-AAA259E19]|uniref:Ferredoxin n=1 Tax=candidate division MSBL1 archaeon SCGC-AAA259E19 TaxID=1698264 RepID=A0A133UND2_9EURY|nr:hypothetical protein AKJ65_01120 [candidate division MSBL1 archaeon SCGC-AAA259E19]